MGESILSQIAISEGYDLGTSRFSRRGDVSGPTTGNNTVAVLASEEGAEDSKMGDGPGTSRPMRQRRTPARFVDPAWAR